MKRFVLLLIGLLPVAVFGQGIEVQPRHLIDLPTAWPMPRAGFDLKVRAFGGGGALVALSVGVSNEFMFGASYGGNHILGEDSLIWNRAPGILLRYKMIEESFALPAISIGFESQGYGPFIGGPKSRYTNKSRGFYAVGSKSYDFFEHLDFHGGVNYSLERTEDGTSPINFFMGGALAFNQDFELLAEYDFAVNDTKDKEEFGSGNGYLNAGLRLNIKKVVYIELFLKNLTKNRRTSNYFTREFQLTFFQYIL